MQALMHAFTNSYDSAVEMNVPSEAGIAEAFNLVEGDVRRLVMLGKSIPSFNNLSLADQIVLLKGSFIEIAMTHTLLLFNYEKLSLPFLHYIPGDRTNVVVTEVSYALFTSSPESKQLLDMFTSLCRKYRAVTLYDPAVNMCLICHMLFKIRPGFEHEARDQINYTSQYFLQLLNNYIKIVYVNKEVKFVEVLNLRSDIVKTREMSEEMLQNIPASQLTGFVQQLLDKM